MRPALRLYLDFTSLLGVQSHGGKGPLGEISEGYDGL